MCPNRLVEDRASVRHSHANQQYPIQYPQALRKSKTDVYKRQAVNGSPYGITITNAAGSGLSNYTISYVNGQLTLSLIHILSRKFPGGAAKWNGHLAAHQI